jgi:hypothetical protein
VENEEDDEEEEGEEAFDILEGEERKLPKRVMTAEDRPTPIVKEEVLVKQEEKPDATMETPTPPATTDVTMGETPTQLSYGKQRLNMYPVKEQNLPAASELTKSGMIPAGWLASDISYVIEWRKEIVAQVRKHILFRGEQVLYWN